jgi:LPS-assembly protein
MVGLGYYQTIGRSMDATYVLQDFTSRGYAHHLDFRGKPTQKSDFNLIFYGVQDRGIIQNGALLKAPGYSITGTGKIEFGDGWVARGAIDYLSSYLFHQQFTDSYSQAIFSETHSSAYVEKHFGDYTFDISASRTQNFLDTTPGNSVVIRTLPELELNNNFQQIASGPVPLWFSLHATYGLFHRVEPLPTTEPVVDYYETSQFTSRADFEPSLTSAIHLGSFTLIPEVTQHETFYSQTLVNYVVSSNTLMRSAPEAKADLIFPSLSRVFNRKTVFGDKLKHVIEPRARYDYVTGVKNFNDTLLFDPTDLLTNTREVQFSIANRIYAKRGETVSEIFSWNVSEKYYFDPTFGGALVPGQRNVMMTELNLTGYSFLDGIRRESPIVSTVRASPITGLSFTWQGDYDPTTRRIVNSSLAANVRVRRYFVTVGSDQIRPDPILAAPENQFRTTFGYGDSNRKGLNAAFSMVYDYRLSLLEYGIAQVTYNTSCCGFSIQVRRLDFGTVVENQYLASFSIANVASVGTLKKQERIF